MPTLGRSFDAETVPFSECEGFVCKMYGKPKLIEVNEYRYITFCAKQGQSQSLGWMTCGCTMYRVDDMWMYYCGCTVDVDVLQTAQLITVDAKEMAYPVQNYARAARHVTILTTMCLRTVKATKNLRLC